MLIEPTPPGRMKGTRTIIKIDAVTDQKYRKPADNAAFFGASTAHALTEAIAAGYDSAAYFSVNEYVMRAKGSTDVIEYVYRWVFVPTRMNEEPIPAPTTR